MLFRERMWSLMKEMRQGFIASKGADAVCGSHHLEPTASNLSTSCSLIDVDVDVDVDKGLERERRIDNKEARRDGRVRTAIIERGGVVMESYVVVEVNVKINR